MRSTLNGFGKQVPLLKLSGVSLQFGKQPALKQVNLVVYPRQTIGIVGASGSGKTCLANVVYGRRFEISARLRGKVHWPGLPDNSAGENDRYRSPIWPVGMIGTRLEPLFFPGFYVGIQISESLKHAGRLPSRMARKMTLEFLALTGISEPNQVYRLRPTELSEFQAFQVKLAMVLSHACPLIVADEPWRNMGFQDKIRAVKLLKALQSLKKFSLMLLSADLGLVADAVDYIYVLKQGAVVEQGPTFYILEQPVHPETRQLLQKALRALWKPQNGVSHLSLPVGEHR